MYKVLLRKNVITNKKDRTPKGDGNQSNLFTFLLLNLKIKRIELRKETETYYTFLNKSSIIFNKKDRTPKGDGN